MCVTNTLAVAREQALIILYVFTNTMTELNQKLAKSMPRRYSIRAIYTREKHLCMNLGLKRREGICSKGSYFWEITVHTWLVCGIHEQSSHHISLNNKGRPRCYANSHPLNREHFSQNCVLDYRTNCDLLCIRQCATCALRVLTLLYNNSTTVFSSNITSSSFVPSASSLWSLTICSNGGRRPGVSYHVMDLLPPLLHTASDQNRRRGRPGNEANHNTCHSVKGDKFSSLTPGLLPWLMYSVYKALFS